MKTLFITIFTLLIRVALAQPSISSQRCYGGTGSEIANKMYDCNGNGFLVFGETSSNNGDVSGNHGGKDIWVFRNDSTGTILWQKCYGGSNDETMFDSYQTKDGGYIVLGSTFSNNGDVSGNIGGRDIWVFKIDSLGNLLWQNSIGGNQNEPDTSSMLDFYSYYKASTKEIIFYFTSLSNNGELTASLGNLDLWTTIIDSLGNFTIQNPLSSTGWDELLDVWDMSGNTTLVRDSSGILIIGQRSYPQVSPQSNWGGRTTDGGFIISWEAPGCSTWDSCYQVKKYTSTGVLQGDFGFYNNTGCPNFTPYLFTYDSSYTHITANGFIVHYEFYFPGCAGPQAGHGSDFYEYSNGGTLIQNCEIWDPTLGGGPYLYGTCPTSLTVTYTPPLDSALEGGYIKFSTNNTQIELEKSNFSYALEWTKSMGGSGIDEFKHYVERQDTTYWVLGNTDSNNGDVSGNHGSEDIWFTSLSLPNNWIEGYVWEDVNNNGVIDAGDQPYSNLLLQGETSVGNVAYGITQANGKYELNVGVGNIVVSAPNPPLYHTFQPLTDTISFVNNNGNIDSLHNFLLVAFPNIQDLKITLTALSPPQIGLDRDYDLTYKNIGTQTSNATIRYVFNGYEIFMNASPAPDTLTATYASWNVSNIVPAASGSIALVMNTNSGIFSNLATSIANIYPFTGDLDLTNNVDSITESLIGSYDPNDKLLTPTGNHTLSAFLANDEYLTYTVRFQNTGNAPAVNIVIKDTLSLSLDITSLEILASSHDFVATIVETNKLVITYNNIMLPDSGINFLGSQGFIKFRIKPKSNVGYCQAVENKAYIYFDVNLPIVTNEVSTLFLPDAPTFTYTVGDTICQYTSFTLTCSNPAPGFQNTWGSNGGTFSPTNFLGLLTDNQVIFNNTLTGYKQITLQQSIANIPGCVVNATPFVFFAAANPVADLPLPNYETCEGNVLNVTAPVNPNMICHYVWFQDGLVVGIDSITYPVSQLSQQGFYAVQVTNQYGCTTMSDSNLVSVRLNPTVSINALGSPSVCIGDTVTLTATTSAGISSLFWQKNNNPIAGGPNGTLSAIATGAYRAIADKHYYAIHCYDTSNVINVTINPLPIIAITNVGSLAFCDGNSIILNATNTVGYNYVWNESGNPIAGAISNTYQALLAGTYTVTVVDSNGCTKTSLPRVVTVNPTPNVITNIIGSTALCQGDTLLLIANATPGVTFQWKKNNSNVAGGANDSLFVTTNGNYHVVVSNASNCKDTSTIIAVTVNPLPTATLTNVGSLTFCDGNSVTLNANIGAGYNYVWNESGNPIAGATGSSYQATQNGTYTVTVIDSNSCTKTSLSKIVVVNPSPTVSALAMGDTSLCQGETLLLTANATAGVSFQWKKNGSNAPNGTTDSLVVTTTGNYSVIVNNNFNCKDTSEIITVNVHALPAIPTITQSGATLTSSSAASYQWYLNGTAIVGANSQSYTATQNGTYYVIVANVFGCEKQSLNKVLTTVGIEKGLGEGIISIYPNPAQEVIFVAWESETNTNVKVSLIDVAGKEVFYLNIAQKTKTEVMIPVVALAEGVYLVRVEENEAVYTEKVIVKR